jgi:hypothetical protein
MDGCKHLIFSIRPTDELLDYLNISSILVREITGYNITLMTSHDNVPASIHNKIIHICEQYTRGVPVQDITDMYGNIYKRTLTDMAAIRMSRNVNSPVSGAVNDIFKNVITGNMDRTVWQSLVRNLGESLFSLAHSASARDSTSRESAAPSGPREAEPGNITQSLHSQLSQLQNNASHEPSQFEVHLQNTRNRISNTENIQSSSSADKEVYIIDERSETQSQHDNDVNDGQTDVPNTENQGISIVKQCVYLINMRILQKKTRHPNFRKHTIANYKKVQNYLKNVLHVELDKDDIISFMNEIIRINPSINAP